MRVGSLVNAHNLHGHAGWRTVVVQNEQGSSFWLRGFRGTDAYFRSNRKGIQVRKYQTPSPQPSPGERRYHFHVKDVIAQKRNRISAGLALKS